MKRSEMINKIEILLETIGYVGPSNSGEKVMDLIEKAGMLPPTESTWHSPVSYIWDKEDK